MTILPMKKYFLVFILFILLVGCNSKPPANMSYINEDASILAFGDSLTFGYGVKKQQSYPSVLSQLIAREVINEGVSGEESAEGLDRLEDLLDEYQPSLLILCHGGNDFLRKKPIRQLEANVIAMIEMAKSRGISVLLIGVPKPELLLTTAELYQRVAEQTQVAYDGDIIKDILSSPSLHSDLVHPNAQGYQKLAQAIADLLRQAKAI